MVPAPDSIPSLIIPSFLCQAVPLAVNNVPVCVKLLFIINVPAFTFNVPLLLNAVLPIVLVPLKFILNVPVLLNTAPPLPVEPILKNPPVWLLKTADEEINNVPSSRFTVPKFSQVLPTPRILSAVVDNVEIPFVTNVPVPFTVPPVQLRLPLTVTSLDPVNNPAPSIAILVTVRLARDESISPITRRFKEGSKLPPGAAVSARVIILPNPEPKLPAPLKSASVRS